MDLAPATSLAGELAAILDRPQDGIALLRSPLAGADLNALVRREQPQAAYVVMGPRPGGRRDLSPLFAGFDGVSVFAVVDEKDPRRLFELLDQGAADFLVPPLDPADLLARLWRFVERLRPECRTTRQLRERVGLARLVGQSEAFLDLTRKIPTVAGCDASVLLCGETGTGKELVARAIHYLSPRTGGPFVPVNCAAIPPDLVEDELFGHERSAFTGATEQRRGLVEEAEEGTLLFDEIDCLSGPVQVKLLRFLQDREFRRIGSNELRTSNARVIAATNSDLTRSVARGDLREDLYYRLNVVQLTLPPLRDRTGDIPLLAQHFLRRFSDRFGRRLLGLSTEAMAGLLQHDWPGNVRELEHVMERAVVFAEGQSVVQREDLDLPPPVDCEGATLGMNEARERVVASFERRYLEDLLAHHRGNVTRAAEAAGRSRRGISGLIQKYRIDVKRFRA